MAKAENCVICCIDFRFQEKTYNWLSQKHMLGNTDVISIAGTIRDLVLPIAENDREALIKEIDISINLHNPNNIFVLDHQDCGGYAQDDTIPTGLTFKQDIEQHKKFAVEGKKILQQRYPDKNIEFYYEPLNGEIIKLDL
ncbi:MAG: carbonic anhydrase [Patescibacteria group bacterium]